MSDFIDRVRELMDANDISQKELAKLSGISESSICRYLAGTKEPRMDVLSNIARALNTTSSYLLGENNDGPKCENAYQETVAVVMRNKKRLTDKQKAELAKILFGSK